MEDIGVDSLMIEVTNRCNLNCPHCYYYEDGEKGTDYNDFIDLKAIDHLLNDMKIKYIWTLNFTGGEPLLAEAKIIEVLHKILEDNVLVISIDIASNGTILSEKFAYELNEFSKKQYYFLKNHGMKEVRKQIENFDKNKPDTFPNECTVNFRISNLWHSNDPKRAYEFYKEKMPNVLVEIMSEDISDEEFKEIFILDGTASEKDRISYSGRAKKLTNYNFYCEPLYHKIVYDNNNFEVKCPLKMSYNGKISLAGACSQCDCNKAAIGSVFDGNNYTYDSCLTALNKKKAKHDKNGNNPKRQIFKSKQLDVYLSTDFIHGGFEVYNKKPTHQGQFKFNGEFEKDSDNNTHPLYLK